MYLELPKSMASILQSLDGIQYLRKPTLFWPTKVLHLRDPKVALVTSVAIMDLVHSKQESLRPKTWMLEKKVSRLRVSKTEPLKIAQTGRPAILRPDSQTQSYSPNKPLTQKPQKTINPVSA